MPDLLIRNLNEVTLDKLKKRARQSGRSLQNEAKLILERAVSRSLDESLEVASRWRRKLGAQSTDTGNLQHEERQR